MDTNNNQVNQIQKCCVNTIKLHVKHNPMMVCNHCKQIIKCFDTPQPYNNYVKFCKSRSRPVTLGLIEGYHTVIFEKPN